MKQYKMRYAGCVAAVMAMLLLPMTVYAHTPLVSWDQCPANANGFESRFAPLPTFVHNTVGSEVTAWPAVGTYNFCAYMDTVFCQLKVVATIEAVVADYANLLRCLDADINGLINQEPAAGVPVTVSVNSSGQCTVYWNGILVHENVQLPGWAPAANWYMGFGARTGGSTDYHIVDDVALAGSAMNYNENFSSGPGLGTLYGSAVISEAKLRLTEPVNSQQGSWTFLPTAPLGTFNVSYYQYIGGGSGADGMSFVYGPGATGAFGESGPGDKTGLILSFYTYGDNKNKVQLVYNGTVVGEAIPGELRSGGEELPISGNGMLDGQYEMALLAHVLNTPEHPLHTAAHAAIQQNFIYCKNLVQGALESQGYLGMAGLLAKWLVGSLSMTLAGYAALNDATTYDALDELLDLLSDIGLSPPPGGVIAVTAGVDLIGPNADFEGDGFTNIEEYLHIEQYAGLSVPTYLNWVMNPPSLSIAGAKYYQVGSTIRLSPRLQLGGIIEDVAWEKGGAPIGTGTPLTIADATYADAGEYFVNVTHRMGESKSTAQISAYGTVVVGDDPVPVAGVAGLAVITGMVALVATRRLRRRDR